MDFLEFPRTFKIKASDIHFDTTSLVMWSEYEPTNLEHKDAAELKVWYGNSKQKRSDRKQIKIGIETSNGAIIDAYMLSGNHNDKRYNQERIALGEAYHELKKFLGFDGSYIVDSAVQNEEYFRLANKNGIKLLTRILDSYHLSKEKKNVSLTIGKKAMKPKSRKKKKSEV